MPKSLMFQSFSAFYFPKSNTHNNRYNTESLVKYLHFEPGQIFIALRVIILISNRISMSITYNFIYFRAINKFFEKLIINIR